MDVYTRTSISKKHLRFNSNPMKSFKWDQSDPLFGQQPTGNVYHLRVEGHVIYTPGLQMQNFSLEK